MLTREQARQIDRNAIDELKIPSIILMENAGRGCAEILLREVAESEKEKYSPGETKYAPSRAKVPTLLQIVPHHGVVICCGPGNNGGDGFVIARHLHLAKVPVKIILLANPQQYRGDAAINWQIVQRLPIEIVFCRQDDTLNQECLDIASLLTTAIGVLTTWIVDAILGTGSNGPLRQSLVPWVRAINQASARRLAVDLPTGMDCDTGVIDPVAVMADITCTFVDRKQGFTHPDAGRYLGRIETVHIGCP